MFVQEHVRGGAYAMNDFVNHYSCNWIMNLVKFVMQYVYMYMYPDIGLKS